MQPVHTLISIFTGQGGSLKTDKIWGSLRAIPRVSGDM
jgi:hypothetical protein